MLARSFAVVFAIAVLASGWGALAGTSKDPDASIAAVQDRKDKAQECEKRREGCIASCGKQRATCDKNNPNDSKYCVNQDQQCQRGCETAWKKCNETDALTPAPGC